MTVDENLPFTHYICAKVDFVCPCGRTQKHKREKIRQNECRYWIADPEIKNCILKIDRGYGAKETARKLGISHQAIYAIEVKVKKKLKAALYHIWEDYKESISDMRVW